MAKKTSKARQQSGISSLSKTSKSKNTTATLPITKGGGSGVASQASIKMHNLKASENLVKRKSSFTPSTLSHKPVSGGGPSTMQQLQRQSSQTDHPVSTRSHKVVGTTTSS